MAEFLCPSKVTHIIEACSRKALSLASLQELSRATQQRLQDLDQVTWRLQSAWLSKGVCFIWTAQAGHEIFRPRTLRFLKFGRVVIFLAGNQSCGLSG